MSGYNKTTHLCIVRHGESVWNFEKRIQGHSNPELSPLGEKQALAAAKRLAAESWDAVYSSDLRRAYATARCLAKLIGKDVIQREDLRERYGGRLEGLSISEARQRYPDWDAAEVGRESLEELGERAYAAFDDIIRSHPGERIVVVSHGGLIRRYLIYLQDLNVIEPEQIGTIENTSITRIEWQQSRGRVEVINDFSHLSRENLLRSVS